MSQHNQQQQQRKHYHMQHHAAPYPPQQHHGPPPPPPPTSHHHPQHQQQQQQHHSHHQQQQHWYNAHATIPQQQQQYHHGLHIRDSRHLQHHPLPAPPPSHPQQPPPSQQQQHSHPQQQQHPHPQQSQPQPQQQQQQQPLSHSMPPHMFTSGYAAGIAGGSSNVATPHNMPATGASSSSAHYPPLSSGGVAGGVGGTSEVRGSVIASNVSNGSGGGANTAGGVIVSRNRVYDLEMLNTQQHAGGGVVAASHSLMSAAGRSSGGYDAFSHSSLYAAPTQQQQQTLTNQRLHHQQQQQQHHHHQQQQQQHYYHHQQRIPPPSLQQHHHYQPQHSSGSAHHSQHHMTPMIANIKSEPMEQITITPSIQMEEIIIKAEPMDELAFHKNAPQIENNTFTTMNEERKHQQQRQQQQHQQQQQQQQHHQHRVQQPPISSQEQKLHNQHNPHHHQHPLQHQHRDRHQQQSEPQPQPQPQHHHRHRLPTHHHQNEIVSQQQQQLTHQKKPQQQSSSSSPAAENTIATRTAEEKRQLQPSLANIKTEPKPLNFPRRKLVQTERSSTLPICQRCKQVFLKRQSYTQHVALSCCNIVEYDFKCAICPMSFMSNEELQTHEQLHRLNRYFCQKYCGKYYESIEECEQHEFGQHEYDMFKCNICCVCFPKREQLFNHLMEHRQHSRYDCCICRICFQTLSELEDHYIGNPAFCGKFYDKEAFKSLKIFSKPKPKPPQLSTTSRSDGLTSFMIKDITSTKIPEKCLPPAKQRKPAPAPQPERNSPPPLSMYDDIPNFAAPLVEVKTEIKVEPDFYPPMDHGDFAAYDNEYSNSQDYSQGSNQNSTFLQDFHDNASNSTNSSFSVNTTTSASNNNDTTQDEDAVCCVARCGVRKCSSPTLQFFPFPRDEKYLSQWLHNLKMTYDPNVNYGIYRVCSLHFPKRCVARHSLSYWAVPTFNLGHDDVGNLYQNRESSGGFPSGEMARCYMPGCLSQRGETNVKFHSFPRDLKTLIKWCQNSRLPIHSKETRFFCSRHFEEKCFGKFRLKPWAIPTLRLGTVYGKIHDNPNIYQEEKKCFLPFCRRSRSYDCNLSLYRFPRDETLLRRWCYNLRLEPEMYRGKNHKICSSHFVKEALGLRKLNPGAVPTMNLGHNDKFNIYENELYTPPPPPPAPPQPSTSSKAQKFAEMFKQDMNSASAIYDEVFMSSMVQKFSGSSSSNVPNLDLGDVCLVPSCKRTRHTDDVTLHTVPKRAEQLKKWCHNLKMDLEKLHKSVRICSAHFESYCIGGCMRPFAVPTLELGHDDADIFRNPDVIKKLNIRETCCVPCCKRNRDRDHANLHRFPTHPELLQKWCENLQKPIPDGTKLFNDAVCEVHFEDRCLRNKRLEKWSIPTLNLGYEDTVHKLPSEEEIAEHWTKSFTPNNGDEQGDCCVPSCKRNPQIDDVRLYRPPEDAEQMVKWAHNLQVEVTDLPNLKICNLHFESHCIGKRLLNWAMPTLNLGSRIEHLFENPPPTQVVYYKKKEKALKIASSHDGMKWAPRCCLSHCRKTRSHDNIQLFRFPYVNRSTLAKWCHNIQLPLVGSSHRRLCSSHFEPSVLTKRCPMNLAVPTQNLNAPIGYKIYQNPARLKQVKIGAQRQCIIESCRKTKVDGVVLFRFPNNRTILQKWRHNIKNSWPKGKLSSQLRVCSEHFESHSVGGKRLSPGAIPTLKLGHDSTDLYPNETRSFFDLEKCAVSGCDSRKSMDDIRLFRFPRDDEELLQKWCNNLKMNPLDCVGIRVCIKHFEEECIGPKLIFKWAIPTLNLGHKEDDDVEIIPNPPPEQRSGEFIFKCCVPSCGKTRKYDDAQMNSFPKHLKQFRKWKHNLKLDILNFKEREKYKICNDHFEPVCVGKTRLNFGALPTINLGHNDTEDLYKINPERIRPNLFISQKDIDRMERKQLRLDMDNDEQHQHEFDQEQDDDPLDPLSTPMECCVEECKAPKPLMREPYDIPECKELRKLWSGVLKRDVTDVTAVEGKICGLHYQQMFLQLKNEMESLAEENPEVKLDYGKLLYAYQKSEISLVIKTYQCRVDGCSTNPLNSDVRLYFFPYGKEIVKKWTFNTGIIPDEHRRYLNKVCALHFEPFCITDTQRLRSWAIPTLNLKHDNPEKLYKNPDLTRIDRRMLGPQIWKCAVQNCDNGNATDAETVRFFNFPTDDGLLEKWCANLKMSPRLTPLYKICAIHFEKQCLGSSRVRSWAIPTLHLGHNEDPEYFNKTTIKNEVYEEQSNRMEQLQLKQVKIKKSLDTIKCNVSSCRRSRLQHGVRFYPLPANPKMKRKWMHNLQIPSHKAGKVTNLRICNLHFHKRCFDGKQLKNWTVPTMHLGHSEPIFDNPRRLQNPLTVRRCVLQHCANRNVTNDKLRTFVFPKAPEFLERWAQNLKMEMSQCKGRLCSEHFEAGVKGVKKLKNGAVPTLKLGHGDELLYDNNELIKRLEIKASQKESESKDEEMLEDDDDDEEQEEEEEEIEDDEEFDEDDELIEYHDDEEEEEEEQEQEQEQDEDEEDEVDMDKVRIRGTLQHWSSIKMKELRVTLVPISKEELLEISSVSSYERDRRSVTPANSLKDLRSDTPASVIGVNTSFETDRRSVAPANSNSRDVRSETPISTSEAAGQTSNDRELRSVTPASSNSRDLRSETPASVGVGQISLECNEENSSGTLLRTDKPINGVAPMCCLKHCGKEKTPEQHLTTYGFPKDPQVLLKWCDNLGLQPEECIGRLCIDHFELRVIMTRRLRPGAVPTLNLGHARVPKHTNDELPKDKKGAITTETESKVEAKSEQVPAPPPPYTNPKPIGKQSVFRLCCLKHCRRKKQAETEEEKQTRKDQGKPYLLFKFPQDSETLKKWASNLRLPEKICGRKELRVCSKHFEPSVITGKQLKPYAIPTIDLSYSQRPPVYRNSCKEIAQKSKRRNKKLDEVKCYLPHCQRKEDDKTFLLSFPLHCPSQQRRWCRNLKLDSKLKHCRELKICNHHFESYVFFKQRNLKTGAVPTLDLGHSDPISNNLKKLRRKVRVAPKETCCVKTCENQDPKKLYAFPKNSELRRIWRNNLQIELREALSCHYKLCDLHFSPESFEVGSDTLKISAVPSLKLGVAVAENHKVLSKIQTAADECQCVVENCLKSSSVDKVKLFELPKSKDLLKKWLFNLNLSPDIDLVKTRICSRHFEKLCIKKGNLHPKAVPTRCLKAKTSFYENDDEVYEENYKCCALQCNYATHEEEDQPRQMYRFPKQKIELLNKWLHNLKLMYKEDQVDFKHLRVCEIHFENACKSKEHLLPDSVPTLQLGHDQIQDIYRNHEIQKCCIENCQWLGYHCHKLPENIDIKTLWLKQMEKESMVHSWDYICSVHFVSWYEKIYDNSKPPKEDPFKKLYEELTILPELRAFKCSVPNCKTGFKLIWKLFQFPSNVSLFQKWLHNTSLTLDYTERSKYHICAQHFEERCLSEKKLHRWSLPTLALPFNLSLYVNPPEALPSHHENLKHCCVSSCNMSKGPFFKFPPKSFDAKKWKHNLDLGPQQSTLNLRVCHRHFEEYCFSRDEQNRITKLKFWSVPTLHLKRIAGLHDNPTDKQDYFFCCVCKERQNKPEGLYLFRFPTKLSSFLKWLHNLRLQRQDYRDSMRVCIKHFDNDCFNKTLKLLRRRSVPTIGVPCPLNEVFTNPKRKLTSKCCVASCEGPWPDLNPFPKDSILLKKWYFNLNLKQTKDADTDTETVKVWKICQRHFESKCLNAFGVLRPTALPTLNLGHNNKIFKNPRVISKSTNNQRLAESSMSEMVSNKLEKQEISIKDQETNTSKKAGNEICMPQSMKRPRGRPKKNVSGVMRASRCMLNAKIKIEGQKYEEQKIISSEVEPQINSAEDDDLDEYQTLGHYIKQQRQMTMAQKTESLKNVTKQVTQPRQHKHSMKMIKKEYEDKTGIAGVAFNASPLKSPEDLGPHKGKTLGDFVTQRKKMKALLRKNIQSLIMKKDKVTKMKTTQSNNTLNTIKVEPKKDTCINIITITETPSQALEASEEDLDEFKSLREYLEDRKQQNNSAMATKQIKAEAEKDTRQNIITITETPSQALEATEEDLDEFKSLREHLEERKLQNNSAMTIKQIKAEAKKDTCQNIINFTENPSNALKAPNELTNEFKKLNDNVMRIKEQNTPSNKNEASTSLKSNVKNDQNQQITLLNKNPGECMNIINITETPSTYFTNIVKKENEAKPLLLLKNNAKYNTINNTNVCESFEIDLNPPCEGVSNSKNVLPGFQIKQELLLEEMHQHPYEPEGIYPDNVSKHDYFFDDDTSLSYSEAFSERPSSAQRQHVRQYKCSVVNCHYNFNNFKTTCYKLPPHMQLRWIWMRHCQESSQSPIIFGKKFKLCKDHFEDQCFVEDRLLLGAIPTLNLGPKTIPNMQDCSETLKSFREFRCRIDDCQRSQELDQIHSIPFPSSNDEYRSKWLYNLNIQESDISESDWLCHKHFERRMVFKGKLKAAAVPTLLLGSQTKSEEDLYKNPEYIPTMNHYAQLRQVCCVSSCSNTKQTAGNIRFCPFPKRRDIYDKWLHNLDLEDSADVRNAYHICREHFEPICHMKQTLKFASIPTLKLDKKEDLYPLDETQLIELDYFGRRTKTGWIFKKHKCSHPHCGEEKIHVFSGPKIPQLKKVWLDNLNVENPKDYCGDMSFCDEHFYLLYKQCENYLADIENSESFKDEVKLLRNTFAELALKTKFFGRHCFVGQCQTDLVLPQHKDRKLFNFPINPEVSKKWCHNCNVDYNFIEQNCKMNYYKVCDIHFEAFCFSQRSIFSWALPTLNLPDSRTTEIYENDPDNRFGYTGHCCITSCVNKDGLKLETKTRLYRFPENLEHRAKWLHNINCENFQENETKLCGLHFRSIYMKRLKALNELAIPTLRLYPHRQTDDEIFMDIRDPKPTNPNKKEDKDKLINKETIEMPINVFDHDYCFDQKPEISNENESSQFFEMLPIKQEIIEDQYGLEEDQQPQFEIPTIKEEISGKHEYILNEDHKSHFDIPVVKEEIIEIDECNQQQYEIPVIKEEIIEIEESNTYDTTQNYEYIDDMTTVNDYVICESPTTSIFPSLVISDVKSHIFMCCVQKCCNNSETLGVRLYTEFPNDSDIFIKWCFNVKIDPRNYKENQYAICSQHFDSMCFKDGNLSLHSWAVPTLNLNLPDNSFIHQNDTPNEQCIVYGCIQPLNPLYNFPLQLDLCKKWFSNLKLDLTDYRARNYRICRRHFAAECLEANLKLKSDAIPTVYLGHADRILHFNAFEARLHEMEGYELIDVGAVAAPPAGLDNSRGSSHGSAVLARHLISPNDLEDHDSSYFEDYEECYGMDD